MASVHGISLQKSFIFLSVSDISFFSVWVTEVLNMNPYEVVRDHVYIFSEDFFSHLESRQTSSGFPIITLGE